VNQGKPYDKEGLSYSTAKGFALWNINDIAGHKAFRFIFKGPISPGIDSAKEIGFESLLSEQYQGIYNPTKTNPFPELN